MKHSYLSTNHLVFHVQKAAETRLINRQAVKSPMIYNFMSSFSGGSQLPDIVKQLDYIFRPRSIAVIGASDNTRKWGYMMVDRPLRTGFTGKVYPVNPQSQSILGQKCYSSVKDIPDNVDLAVITTQAELVPAVMQECVEKGVKGVVLISAGFAETGEHGKALEKSVMQIARAGGIRCVGPNGMGIWSAAACLNLSFDTAPLTGHISFVSQSGTYGSYMAELANIKGYGLRTFISIGNQGDLATEDYIEYLSHDEGTRAIILYMEGIKDGRRFFNVCKDALKRKPVILYKGGNSPAGARATLSHTASIAGSEEIFSAACRQLGLIRAQEAFQTFEMAVALLSLPVAPGRRVGILGTGGQGVVAVDACSRLGLDVPELDSETSKQLMQFLPKHAPLPRNPVDFAAGYRTALDEAKVVETLMKLDYIDAVISNVPINPMVWGTRFDKSGNPEPVQEASEAAMAGARMFAELPRKYGKPVVCVRWYSDIKKDPVGQYLTEAGVPVYDSPEQCARALYGLFEYGRTIAHYK
jgi:acyl-CoA synthetase (NDP forming)